MDRVRPFTEEDIPQAVRLYQTVFGGGVQCSVEPLEGYFHQVFFENPWSDKALPSQVYETDQGTIAGFLGVIPRRFQMKGRSLKVAVTTQFMVDDSSRHNLAGLKLLQRLFSGPQDLSFTDGANEASRRTWKALGGTDIPIYSICWTRQLGPPAQEYFKEAAPRFTEHDLDLATLIEQLPHFARGRSLRPEYDQDFLTWLLRLAEEKKKHGVLQKRMVRHAEGIAGWYVYYLNAGGTSQVLQLVASPQSFSAVLAHLFEDLRRQGATAVSGRVDPDHLHEFSRQQCQFSAASAVLVRASDPELLRAFYTGDALLSRLEGEWWNCFGEFMTRPQVTRQPVAPTIE
jgi:hypothetical protein